MVRNICQENEMGKTAKSIESDCTPLSKISDVSSEQYTSDNSEKSKKDLSHVSDKSRSSQSIHTTYSTNSSNTGQTGHSHDPDEAFLEYSAIPTPFQMTDIVYVAPFNPYGINQFCNNQISIDFGNTNIIAEITPDHSGLRTISPGIFNFDTELNPNSSANDDATPPHSSEATTAPLF
jgi:hypothetical protein